MSVAIDILRCRLLLSYTTGMIYITRVLLARLKRSESMDGIHEKWPGPTLECVLESRAGKATAKQPAAAALPPPTDNPPAR